MSDDLTSIGIRIRREVLGDAYVDNALKNTDEFNRDFQQIVEEYCWGGVWGREGLSRKQRSLNTLCLLAVMNLPDQFEAHVRGALRNGCTLDEIRETLIQIGVYAGVGTGTASFRIASKVLAEEGYTDPKTS